MKSNNRETTNTNEEARLSEGRVHDYNASELDFLDLGSTRELGLRIAQKIGEKLNDLQREHGFTREFVYSSAQIDAKTYRSCVNGERNTELGAIGKLKFFYGDDLSLDEIMEDVLEEIIEESSY